MGLKRIFICSISLLSFIIVQSPVTTLAKFYTAQVGSDQVTRNVPQVKTTPPEPVPVAKSGGKKRTTLWVVLGLAAVVGVIAAVAAGGGSGGDGSPPETSGSGSYDFSW